MLKIRCYTNIDCARNLQWPDYLPDRPMLGDKIRSISSTTNKVIELEVHAITWVRAVYSNESSEWTLHVDLHFPKGSGWTIPSFENFIKGQNNG